MDPVNIPTSFIPKRPVETLGSEPRSHSRIVGLLSMIAVVAVIATLVAAIGVYLYGSQLQTQQAKLQDSISSAKEGLGADFVADMKRLNNRIEGVKTLLKNHIVVSPIFAALQATTLRSVQYATFDYLFTTTPDGKTQVVAVRLMGSAKNYATIALQSDAFSRSPLIKNAVFSNLTTDDKTQRIGFTLSFTVDPSNLSYQTFIDANAAQSKSTAAAVDAAQAAPTTTTTPVAPDAGASTPPTSSTAPTSPSAPTAPSTTTPPKAPTNNPAGAVPQKQS